LDTYPGDTLSESLFWKTEDHAHQAMMGIYSTFRSNGNVYNRHFMWDELGETAYGYDQIAGIPRGTYTARDGDVSGKWQGLYECVQRANIVITRVSGMSVDASVINQYVAEAKFLRAVAYFELLKFFGGVPYYDETTNVNVEYADLKKPRSSADEIRAYIIADLKEAINALPVSYAASEYGRATKGAAYALLGKVYLYNKEWKNAITNFEEIVNNRSNNYGYALDPDYAHIFKLYNGDKSPEMIFSIQNKSGVGTAYGMPMNFYMGTRNSYGSCWNNTVPGTQLIDSYEYPDGRPFNWDDIFPGYNAMSVDERKALLCVGYNGSAITLGDIDTAKILKAYTNRDPRLMATAIVPYSHYLGWSANAPKDMLFILETTGSAAPNGDSPLGTMRNNNGSWRTYFYRKFVTEADLDGAISDRAHTPFEFPIIRYADVLLMLAEAYNEDGQLDNAVTQINKVRARVNLPGINSGPDYLAATTKEAVFQRIMKERAWEMTGEGHRFNDLQRWGNAKEVIAANPPVGIYGDQLYTHPFLDRDYLWPIPGAEIERNPDLTQNPGW
jgi:tetratricopeptide (TPR) repeat protein